MGNWLRSFSPWQNRRDTTTYMIPTTMEEGSPTDPDRDPPLSNNSTQNEGAATHPDNAHGTTRVPPPINEDYDNIHSSPTANNPPCQDSDFTHPSSDSLHHSHTCHSENNAQTITISTSIKPGRPIATDITSRGIEIEWKKPVAELSAENVISYTIFYRCASDPDDQWREQKVSGTEERATVSGLTGKTVYYFKVQSEHEDGVQSESDASEPITTLESITLKNVIDRTWKARNKWYLIGLQLGLEASDLDVINTNNNEKPDECFREMIKKWLNHKGGSWRKLIDSLKHETVGEQNLAQSIAIGLGLYATFENQHSSPEDHDKFKNHLKLLYEGLTPTKASANTFPPSATCKVFNLAMIKSEEIRRGQIQNEFIRRTITGRVDDILRDKCPIELKDIFPREDQETKGKQDIKRKVVLLEGAPGCGKSTLSIYISQQWGEGKLFTKFKYVILVQLRDPAIQAASCIADLLPARDEEMRQQAAKDIIANDGEGILFILDGWDELPSNLRENSVFCEMLQPGLSRNSPLLKSAIIVTSRPIASVDLHQCASTRIEILGFTPEELKHYFTDCLKGDSKAVDTLFERIHENPEIAGSCYLPMNASILVHLFINDNNTLPTTQYGIFSELVLSCMYRHHNERTQLKNLTLESLQHIPEAIKEPFLFLCELAYHGIMNDKVIFSKLDDDTKVILPANVDTLGLLQGVESFVRRGKAVSYNFLHLSIQEILAGFYIATQLPDDEQVKKFDTLFNKSRFSAVFQFYAAITKLQTSGIKNVVIRIAKENNKTLLLSLLHCLYEAQDASFCESVTRQLQHRLDFSGTSLTLSDCLCIGYFLAHGCEMATGHFEVNLQYCSIGDHGCKYLVKGMQHQSLDTHSAARSTHLIINLANNAITGDDRFPMLFQVGFIEDLRLGSCVLSHGEHIKLPGRNKLRSLQGSFVEQLKNNSTLKKLDLSGCGLTSQSAKSLAEALTTNKYLEELDISDNAELGDDGIQHLAHALSINQGLKRLNLATCRLTALSGRRLAETLRTNKHLEELNISGNALQDRGAQHLARALRDNQHLKRLELSNCRITDKGLEYLATAIQNNNVLNMLLVHNSFSDNKNSITRNCNPVLLKYLKNNRTLTELYLPHNMDSHIPSIKKAVNDVRRRNGLPLMKILASEK